MVRRVSKTTTAFLKLAEEVDSHNDWWRFPEQEKIKGFLGTGPIFFVGDQPSTNEWAISHPNRKAFYGTILKVGMGNAHLTDLYKKRGRASELKIWFCQEIFMIICPFFGEKLKSATAAQANYSRRTSCLSATLLEHTGDLHPKLRADIWHFSYVGTYERNILPQYEKNIARWFTINFQIKSRGLAAYADPNGRLG